MSLKIIFILLFTDYIHMVHYFKVLENFWFVPVLLHMDESKNHRNLTVNHYDSAYHTRVFSSSIDSFQEEVMKNREPFCYCK